MKDSPTSENSLTLPNGAVKQNRRVLLDDLTGRRIEYTVSPVAIRGLTNYRASGGISYLSAIASVTNCVQRLLTEWRTER